MIEDHQIAGGLPTQLRDLLDLAASREQRRIGARPAPADAGDNGGAGRGRQRRYLVQPLTAALAPEFERDDQGPVAGGGSFEQDQRATARKEREPGPRGAASFTGRERRRRRPGRRSSFGFGAVVLVRHHDR